MTPSQRRYLQFYLEYRDKPLTLLSALRRCLPGMLLFFAASGVMVWACRTAHGPDPVGLFVAGMSAGAGLRMLAYARTVVRAWSLHSQIIDFDKVEQFLAEGATAS